MEDTINDIKICQSCAMPLSVDEDYGNELDGSLNSEYCKFCYQNGKFVDEGISLEEKIEKNAEIASTIMGIPKDEALQIARDTLPTLKRWL